MQLQKAAKYTIFVFAFGLSLSSCSSQKNDTANIEPVERHSSDANSKRMVHEPQWIETFIGQDIAEILCFAANQNRSKKISLDSLDCQSSENGFYNFEYLLKWDLSKVGQRKSTRIEQSIWDPANYSDWAKQLLSALEKDKDEVKKAKNEVKAESDSEAGRNSKEAEDLIKSLANFSIESLADASSKVSQKLTLHPHDPGLHEQAALILSVFALRENAGAFSDVRPWLNRITTHLAIARALRKNQDYNIAGQLAEISQYALGGSQARAVKMIDASAGKKNSEFSKSWLRALKIRASNDFRIADLKKATTIEALQYGRVLANNISTENLQNYKDKMSPKGPDIDWLRNFVNAASPSSSSLPYTAKFADAELSSFKLEYPLYAVLKFEDFPAKLNQILSMRAGRCLRTDASGPRLEIVSDADVAAFHTRHVLVGFNRVHNYIEDEDGSERDAQKYSDSLDKTYSDVRLYPLFKAWLVGTRSKEKLSESWATRTNTIIRDEPEDANFSMSNCVNYVYANSNSYLNPLLFFMPQVPVGTAYDIANRAYDGLSFSELDGYRKLNPYDRKLDELWLNLKSPGKNLTGADYREAYGLLAEVDLRAMKKLAESEKTNAVEYAKITEQIAKLKKY